MQTNSLKRVHPNMKRVIVARGGKRGKTSGRGGKGQTARAGNKRRPEWRDIIKKLPKLRGRGKNSNKSILESYEKPVPVNVITLEAAFKAGDAVTPAALMEKGIIATWSGRAPRVKILGTGEITKALKISGCEISDPAKILVEKAGGSIEPTQKAINAAEAEKKAAEVAARPAKAAPAAEAAPKKAASEKKEKAPAKKAATAKKAK